jgi:hypothetical protein
MEQKNKELLIKDICASGAIVFFDDFIGTIIDIISYE